MKTLMAVALTALLPAGFASAEEFGCNRNALSKEERSRHQALSQTLLAGVQESRELADGYAFRFPADTLVPAAEWVSLERRCCPFFTFVLEQTRDQGPLWGHLTGAKGVKAVIKEEFGF